jgi:hypothetical protein
MQRTAAATAALDVRPPELALALEEPDALGTVGDEEGDDPQAVAPRVDAQSSAVAADQRPRRTLFMRRLLRERA